jgi:hypothetical protein
MPKFLKNLPADFLVDKLMENYAIMPSLRGIGFKARNFGGFSRTKSCQKTFWDGGGQRCRIISDKNQPSKRRSPLLDNLWL